MSYQRPSSIRNRFCCQQTVGWGVAAFEGFHRLLAQMAPFRPQVRHCFFATFVRDQTRTGACQKPARTRRLLAAANHFLTLLKPLHLS